MKNNRKVIFYIPFNVERMYINQVDVVGKFKESQTEEWIDRRLDLFMNYTLKSLKNQTNQDYKAYVLYHKPSKSIIEQKLAKYPPLPKNVSFIPDTEYDQQIIKEISGFKHFYEIHLHSDDMYHKSFVERMYNYEPKPKTKVLICQNGYIYNSLTNQLAKYYNVSSSFNCYIYNVEDYKKGFRYKIRKWMGAIKLQHEIIKAPLYINHCHDTNSAFFFEQEIKRNKIKDVWADRKGKGPALFGDMIGHRKRKQHILQNFIGSS